MRKTIYYIFALILAYLALVHFTGFSKDLGAAKTLGVSTITALQGR